MMPRTSIYRKQLTVLVLLLLFVGLVFVYTKQTSIQDTDTIQTDTTIKTDGEEFDGLAVFPTWSSSEPATFPVIIDGEAQGVWFFEANFPIEIITPDNTVVGRGYAQAQGEWMTDGIVPFFAEIQRAEGSPEYTGVASLVLRKANASGLPEHDAAFTTQIFIDTQN